LLSRARFFIAFLWFLKYFLIISKFRKILRFAHCFRTFSRSENAQRAGRWDLAVLGISFFDDKRNQLQLTCLGSFRGYSKGIFAALPAEAARTQLPEAMRI